MYADPYHQGTYIAPATYVAPVPTYVPSYEVGRSSNFKKLNCCALLSAITIFAVMIAAASVCWYSYDETYTGVATSGTGSSASSTIITLNYTRNCWDLQGVSTQYKTSVAAEVNSYLEYDSSTSVWSIFKLMQAFVLIALILSGLIAIFILIAFADSVRNRLLFSVGMNVLRLVLLVVAILILVSLIIAFLGFLGITQAFSDDSSNCVRGNCRRFADDNKESLGTSSVTVNGVSQVLAITSQVNFGPNAGWYLTLACIPIAILLCCLVILNKFPIPVDSVGSGEAL
jgi:hypothetical protein